MTEPVGTYRYMNELKQVQDLIKNYPVSASGKPCMYEIFYVVPGDAEWKQAEWPNEDYKRFLKRAEEIIQLHEPDALKIKLHLNKKRQEHIIRLMPDKHIPVIDGNKEKQLDRRAHRQQRMQQHNTQTQELNGHDPAEYKSETGLGALQVQNLQKDFDIKLLQRDVDQLKKESQKLEQENKELTEALYEYENKADKGKLENLGLLIGAGKLLKMDNQSLLGLAGMLMGDGQADMNLLTEATNQEQKGGGLDLSGGNPEREEALSTINVFLGSIEEESFRKVITLLQLIEKNNSLVDELLKYAFQQSTETMKSDQTD